MQIAHIAGDAGSAVMSKIEWTHRTINPIVGCSKISRACDNCYAQSMAYSKEHVHTKNGKVKLSANYEGVSRLDKHGAAAWTSRVNYDPKVMKALTPSQKPQRFFVNSMSDFFHANVKLEWLQEIFADFARCPQHTFMILTKRPENAVKIAHLLPWGANVWLGVTVEDDTPAVLGRIDNLRLIPAARKFISAEPLTADIASKISLAGIDWVIVGGESTPVNVSAAQKAMVKRMEPAHALALKDLCERAGVAFFFKQWGSFSQEGVRRGHAPHGEGLKGKVYHNWPKDAEKPADKLHAIRWHRTPRTVQLLPTGALWLPERTLEKQFDRADIEGWLETHAEGEFYRDESKGIAFLTPNAAFHFKMTFA